MPGKGDGQTCTDDDTGQNKTNRQKLDGNRELSNLARQIADMRAEISAKLADVDATQPRFDVALGLGYVGQSYHVPVSVNPDAVAALTTKEVLESFATTYRTKYGYYYDDVPVELVNVHVTGTAGGDVKILVELPASAEDATSVARGQRSAYSVSRRTHEMGVRMALGAEGGRVLRMVVRQALVLSVAGVALGVASGVALTRLMRSMLFQVSATDPTAFVGASLFLLAVAVIAGYVPARRAARVDPMIALRHE